MGVFNFPQQILDLYQFFFSPEFFFKIASNFFDFVPSKSIDLNFTYKILIKFKIELILPFVCYEMLVRLGYFGRNSDWERMQSTQEIWAECPFFFSCKLHFRLISIVIKKIPTNLFRTSCVFFLDHISKLNKSIICLKLFPYTKRIPHEF